MFKLFVCSSVATVCGYVFLTATCYASHPEFAYAYAVTTLSMAGHLSAACCLTARELAVRSGTQLGNDKDEAKPTSN